MQLLTRNGHNMYDMASMMQKAIRRGLIREASYAAYELYGGYYNYCWKRLLIISAEDCYGIMTKEIIALKLADDEVNKGKKGYDREYIFLAKAVVLLCMAKKNRDGCYVACNFMDSDRVMTEEELAKIGFPNPEEMKKLEDRDIPDWVFDVHTLRGKHQLKRTELDMIVDEEKALEPHQYNLFDYGDWGEYCDKAMKNVSPQEKERIEEFKANQKKKQEELGITSNFD